MMRCVPALILLAGLCLTLFSSAVAAETTVRVLLTGGNGARLPQKDEGVERLAVSTGEVLFGGMQYFGKIEIWRGKNGLYVVNELPLEEYVKGVVSGEVGRSWDIEALKAQAVVSRTYVLMQKAYAVSAPVPYDVTSSVLHQVFKGGDVPEPIARAVEDTRGEILTFDGGPIVAYFHSTSGGITEDAAEVFGKSYPYLKPVETNSELSPYFLWQKKIALKDMEKASGVKGLKDIGIDSHTASGRVRTFSFVNGSGSTKIAAKTLRQNLGWDKLPSTFVTSIMRDNGAFIIEGRGYGHGVGMCQWSALQMARDGKTYRDILSYFYQGTVLQQYEDR
jgi:stage II sporulation protein D